MKWTFFAGLTIHALLTVIRATQEDCTYDQFRIVGIRRGDLRSQHNEPLPPQKVINLGKGREYNRVWTQVNTTSPPACIRSMFDVVSLPRHQESLSNSKRAHSNSRCY